MRSLDIKKLDESMPWLDYSSLSMFMECPRQYWWRNIQGLTQSGGIAALEFGKAIHHALSFWHKNKNDYEAINLFIDEMKDCPPDTKRNIMSGCNCLRFYFSRWRDEEYTTIDTEIAFAIALKSQKNNEFCFTGRIDRYCSFSLGKCVMESKTTSIAGDRWLMRAKPNLQIDGYIAAIYAITGEAPEYGCLDVIHIHEDEKKLKHAQRVLTTRNKSSISIWEETISSWYDMIDECRKNKFFPMNTNKCIPVVGYSCNYTELCSMYPNACDTAELDIPESFKREFWNPLKEIS